MGSQSTSVSQQTLVSQILSILQPQIIKLVQTTISRQEQSSEDARWEEIRRQQAADQAKFEANRLEQQQLEAERYRQEQLLIQQQENLSISSSGSSALSTLFGTGHEVKSDIGSVNYSISSETASGVVGK